MLSTPTGSLALILLDFQFNFLIYVTKDEMLLLSVQIQYFCLILYQHCLNKY